MYSYFDWKVTSGPGSGKAGIGYAALKVVGSGSTVMLDTTSVNELELDDSQNNIILAVRSKMLSLYEPGKPPTMYNL